MLQREVLNDVDAVIANKRRSYEALLRCVEEVCNQAKKRLGPNVVSRVYGRDAKQAGEILKTNAKIAEKLQKRRKDEVDCEVTDIRDIIGLTAVVQYPDQIHVFIDEVCNALTREGITADKIERVEKPGYYATHVDLVSHGAEHAGLWCELQVKTMLHDAWSAKMHDLNYKPSGIIDARLDSMMRLIANSIEAIEMQSETLRDLITERWRIETAWRRAARRKMFELMPAWMQRSASEAANAIRADMEAAQEAISTAENGSPMLREFVGRVSALRKHSLRQSWAVAAYLGSLRHEDGTHSHFALSMVDDWVAQLIRTPAGKNECEDYEGWSAPLACYAIGEIGRAISMSRDLLTRWSPKSKDTFFYLRINLANFLIEQEYFMPSKSVEARQSVLAEVEEHIAVCAPLEAQDASPFLDLRGMVKVAFAQTAEDVRDAIELIQRGRDEAVPEEKEVAEAYYQLHARLAWRRLLELENVPASRSGMPSA